MRSEDKDTFYDHSAEDEDRKQEERKEKAKKRSTYTKRVIAHPSFKNVGYNESEKLLDTMSDGDCIIRPSSKVMNSLTKNQPVDIIASRPRGMLS